MNIRGIAPAVPGAGIGAVVQQPAVEVCRTDMKREVEAVGRPRRSPVEAGAVVAAADIAYTHRTGPAVTAETVRRMARTSLAGEAVAVGGRKDQMALSIRRKGRKRKLERTFPGGHRDRSQALRVAKMRKTVVSIGWVGAGAGAGRIAVGTGLRAVVVAHNTAEAAAAASYIERAAEVPKNTIAAPGRNTAPAEAGDTAAEGIGTPWAAIAVGPATLSNSFRRNQTLETAAVWLREEAVPTTKSASRFRAWLRGVRALRCAR